MNIRTTIAVIIAFWVVKKRVDIKNPIAQMVIEKTRYIVKNKKKSQWLRIINLKPKVMKNPRII